MPDPVSLETHSRESFEVSAVVAETMWTRPERGGEGVQECRFILFQIMRLGRDMPSEAGIPAILFPPTSLG